MKARSIGDSRSHSIGYNITTRSTYKITTISSRCNPMNEFVLLLYSVRPTSWVKKCEGIAIINLIREQVSSI